MEHALVYRTRLSTILLTPSHRHCHSRFPFLTSSSLVSFSSMMTTNGAENAPRKLKILMLHGFTQSGHLFHAKTRALEKALNKAFPANKQSILPNYPGGVQLTYPTGPLRLRPSDIPGYTVQSDAEDEEETDSWAWWKGNLSLGQLVPMDGGFDVVAKTLRDEGPFDGIIGFSQGAALAAMIASLLETGRKEIFDQRGGMPYPSSLLTEDGKPIHPPLKFFAEYCGFWAPHELYRAFYEPLIQTPSLHVIGSLDSVVEEHRSKGLLEGCDNKKVVYHPGGHFVPTSKDMTTILIAFIKENCSIDSPKEESVEDMDVPF